MADWFYRKNNIVGGPITSPELRRLAHAGMIEPTTEVRRGDSKWMSASKVKGLFSTEEVAKQTQRETRRAVHPEQTKATPPVISDDLSVLAASASDKYESPPPPALPASARRRTRRTQTKSQDVLTLLLGIVSLAFAGIGALSLSMSWFAALLLGGGFALGFIGLMSSAKNDKTGRRLGAAGMALCVLFAVALTLTDSLSRARVIASRSISASHLTGIFKSCYTFSVTNKDRYPDDKITLVRDGSSSYKSFFVPAEQHLLKQAPSPDSDLASVWLEENSSYVWRKGIGSWVSDDTVIAHEKWRVVKNVNDGEGMTVLYGNGYVKWMDLASAARAISASGMVVPPEFGGSPAETALAPNPLRSLPLSRARVIASRSISASHLTGIFKSCYTFSVTNKDRYPDDKITLVRDGSSSYKSFFVPAEQHLLKQAPSPDSDLASVWLEENSSYVWRKGIGSWVSDDTVIAHEKWRVVKNVNDGEGMTVLYGNGYVKWMDLASAARAISASGMVVPPEFGGSPAETRELPSIPSSSEHVPEENNTTATGDEGDIIKRKSIHYKVHDSRWRDQLASFLDNETPDAKFLIVSLEIHNDGTSAYRWPSFKLVDDKGAVHDSTRVSNLPDGVHQFSILDDPLNPGVSRSGVVVFDVPDNREYRLLLGDVNDQPLMVRLRSRAKPVKSDVPPLPPPRQDRKPITNSIGMPLVPVVPGEFNMGYPTELVAKLKQLETWRWKYNNPSRHFHEQEHPRHRVRITSDIYIATHEVTRSQFLMFVKDADYTTTAETTGEGHSYQKRSFKLTKGRHWRSPGIKQDLNHPVVQVSWNDAVAFCKWLSTKEGRVYRLPTEAEWEYCCGAGNDGMWFWGNDESEGIKFANFLDKSGDLYLKSRFDIKPIRPVSFNDRSQTTAPVGSYRPNTWGLFDMIGNVSEWCLNPSYSYEHSNDGFIENPVGNGLSEMRVVRGGSWSSPPIWARTAVRELKKPNTASDLIGFRVVLEAE